MKEHPILFSTPMVQAILEGRKTQTRRVVKPQPFRDESGWWIYEGLRPKARYNSGSRAANFPPNEWDMLTSPYGCIGNRLWVRETWAKTGDNFHDDWPGHGDFYYRADDPFSELEPGSPTKGIFRWCPSIFMPREACRIMLEVTNVRMERLQSITEEDAIAEGISLPNYAEQAIKDIFFPEPSAIYSELWESINGKGSWDKNPWVWVIEFKKD